MLLMSYVDEVSYLHVIARLRHVTTLLCHVRYRTTTVELTESSQATIDIPIFTRKL